MTLLSLCISFWFWIMHCCIPTPTTDNNTSTGMIWITLNMGRSAANRQGNVMEFQGISHSLESGQPECGCESCTLQLGTAMDFTLRMSVWIHGPQACLHGPIDPQACLHGPTDPRRACIDQQTPGVPAWTNRCQSCLLASLPFWRSDTMY